MRSLVLLESVHAICAYRLTAANIIVKVIVMNNIYISVEISRVSPCHVLLGTRLRVRRDGAHVLTSLVSELVFLC